MNTRTFIIFCDCKFLEGFERESTSPTLRASLIQLVANEKAVLEERLEFLATFHLFAGLRLSFNICLDFFKVFIEVNLEPHRLNSIHDSANGTNMENKLIGFPKFAGLPFVHLHTDEKYDKKT